MKHPGGIPRTTTELVAELRGAGLSAGGVLIVHASFKSLGPVAGGPGAVVRALLEVLGPAGTLLMPTFAHPQPNGEFHVATTPSRTGAITEAFRLHPGALRSHHPTHAVSALGPRAAEFIAGHEHTSGLGADSPLHRATLAEARVLMIGCGLRAASIVHIAEAVAKVPYLGRVWHEGYDRPLTIVLPEGSRTLVPPRDPPTCSAGFGVVERALAGRNLLHKVRVGQAECLLFKAGDALETALALLRADPGALLCHRPACPVCPRARAIQA